MRRRDCALIFLLSALLILPVFRNEYLAYWGSIQATFIADARYLNENWPHPQWQPNWYMGTRWDYIYPPALRYGTAAIARYAGVGEARGYLWYIGLMYCVGIAGVYVFVAVASRSRAMAWLATLVAATASPSYLLFAEIAADNAGKRYWPMRWNVLIRYGEGPHMAAFALIPLALAAAWIGLRGGRRAHLGLAALGSALVVSNNFYGATALATFFPVLVWAIFLEERDWRVWLRAAGVAALAYGLTAFWLTPSYLRVTLDNMKLVSRPGNAWSAWVAVAVALALGAATWRWTRANAWTTFVVGSMVLFTVNVVGCHFLDFRVMGEPERLIPEWDLCAILAMVSLCAWMWRRRPWHKAVVLALVCAWILASKGFVRRAHQLIDFDNNHTARLEYRITEWIAANMGGQRVMANGTVRFWYNAWRQMPQVGGGSEQGTLNSNSSIVYYAAAMKTKLGYAVAWLQAVGASGIGVHDATSREVYHDIEEPERYKPLKALYSDGEGNFIYQVPRRFPDLARVVDAARIRSLKPLRDGGPVEPYADVVERGPDRRAVFSRRGPESITVEATLEAGQALLVQETFDPAWRAHVDGRAVPLSPDPVDFMLVDPGPGAHRVELRFETPMENRVGRAATIGSILVLIWLLAPSRLSRPAASSS
jgi:hypothetical protein